MKIYTTSREDYLKAILVLQKRNGEVHSIDIARYLGISKPSVSNAVEKLTHGGFLTVDENFVLHLTESGMQVAQSTYARHCFFSKYLISIGVDPTTAEEDACRMEHAISETSFQKLREHLEKQEHLDF